MKHEIRLLFLATLLWWPTQTFAQDHAELDDLKKLVTRAKSDFDQLMTENDQFRGLPTNKQAAEKESYIKGAQEELKKIQESIRTLQSNSDGYLNGLQSDDLNRKGIETLKDQATKVSSELENLETRYFHERKISDGLKKFGPRISDLLGELSETSESLKPPLSGSLTSSPSASDSNGTPTDGLTLSVESMLKGLFSLLPFFVPILFILACTWWLKHRGDQVEYVLKKRLAQTDQRQQELMDHLNNLSAAVKENANHLSTFDTSVKPLWAEVAGLRASLHSLQQDQRDIIPRPRTEEPPPEPAPGTVSVAEYLGRLVGHSHRAKHALIPPDALQKAGDDGIYVVAPGRRSGLFEVVPGYPRFTSGQDFARYQKFYDCDQPSSGEVFIVELALATYDSASHQYQLYKKGRLQIG